MAATATSMTVPKKLRKNFAPVLAEKTRTEELEEAEATQRFKDVLLKYGGKCSFDGFID